MKIDLITGPWRNKARQLPTSQKGNQLHCHPLRIFIDNFIFEKNYFATLFAFNELTIRQQNSRTLNLEKFIFNFLKEN